jgi:hypothetical protein
MATTMKEIVSLLENWTESGTRKGPEFNSFCRKFKNALTNELIKINAYNIVFNYRHYSISGFFTAYGNCYYFSISDVRMMFGGMRLMYRTAKDYKDYSGGHNQFVNLEEGMALKMRLL